MTCRGPCKFCKKGLSICLYFFVVCVRGGGVLRTRVTLLDFCFNVTLFFCHQTKTIVQKFFLDYLQLLNGARKCLEKG